MRNTATLVLLAAMGHAQAQIAWPAHQEHRDGYRRPAVVMPHRAERGAAFYTESFDNSLNGWTVQTTQGSVNWKWTSTGPGPTSSTYPVPVLNTSTPSGWAIIDDDFEGVPGAATNSSLVSPVIDLSSAPANLKVEFDQYFQEFQQDRTYVGVSTDGGTTWNETEINIGVGRDGRPNPEAVDVNISAWVAANPSNVQLRFRYESVWDYGWQVDNIAILELPANDMALQRTANTAFDFENTEFSFMDYSVYPVTQITALTPSALVRNKGFATQTGVRVNFSVEGPSGPELNGATPPASFTAGQEATVNPPSFTPSGAIGEYTLTYSVTQDQTDDVPDNNSVISRIQVSNNVFAHDDGVVDNFQTQSPDNLSEAFEVGSYFVPEQTAWLTAVQVAVHENTPPGAFIYGAAYFPSASNTEHPDLIDLSTTVAVTSADLNPIGGSTFITIPFSNPIRLDAGQPYLIVAGSFDGPDNVHFATSGISAPQVSNIHYPSLGTDFQFFITRTPMVRAVLSPNVSVGEQDMAGARGLKVQPNPFAEHTRLSFSLQQATHVEVEVFDATGRSVMQLDLGTLGEGPHEHVLNGAVLQPGAYLCTVRGEGLQGVQRIVVAR